MLKQRSGQLHVHSLLSPFFPLFFRESQWLVQTPGECWVLLHFSSSEYIIHCLLERAVWSRRACLLQYKHFHRREKCPDLSLLENSRSLPRTTSVKNKGAILFVVLKMSTFYLASQSQILRQEWIEDPWLPLGQIPFYIQTMCSCIFPHLSCILWHLETTTWRLSAVTPMQAHIHTYAHQYTYCIHVAIVLNHGISLSHTKTQRG